MSDIIREVDEELRREDWEKVWKKYGKFVIAGAVGIVLATAGVVGWKEYDKSRRMADGDRFAAVVAQVENTENPADAAEALAAYAKGAPDGYRTLALFREAKYRAEAGDRAAAIALYDALSGDAAVEPLFRDAATLYAVRMQIADGDRAQLTARLEPLMAEGNPWRYTARELVAVMAMGAGDAEAARQIYAPLADDPNAPQSLRGRAAEMLRALGPSE